MVHSDVPVAAVTAAQVLHPAAAVSLVGLHPVAGWGSTAMGGEVLKRQECQAEILWYICVPGRTPQGCCTHR